MIFYLRSRGIGPEEARQMLCLGFAGETIDAFSTEALRGRVEAGLRHRLMVLPFSTN
jgi:Fe-S cluster assembly scaffold protein SufB